MAQLSLLTPNYKAPFFFGKKKNRKRRTSSVTKRIRRRSKIRAAAGSTVAAGTADKMAAASLSQLDDEIVHGMAIGAVFTDYVSSVAKIPHPPAPSMVSAPR